MESSISSLVQPLTDRERQNLLSERNEARYGVAPPGIILTADDYE